MFSLAINNVQKTKTAGSNYNTISAMNITLTLFWSRITFQKLHTSSLIIYTHKSRSLFTPDFKVSLTKYRDNHIRENRECQQIHLNVKSIN